MTGLRISKVGPAELLVLVWILLNMKNIVKLKINNYNTVFWFVFMFLLSVGSGYGIIFYPNQVSITQLITWLYLMIISLGIYQVFKLKKVTYSTNFLKKLVIVTILWYFFLYLYSLIINNTFLGAPLWYGTDRFSGGADNPHQIAVLLVALTPLILKYMSAAKSIKYKIYYFVLFIIAIFLGFETKASTLQLSIFISIAFLLIMKIMNLNKNKRNKILMLVILLFIFSGSIMLLYEKIMNFIYIWITNDPNGLGRFEIFSTITDTLEKNWIFGLGPGTHAFYGYEEFHNTYLEIIAMSGIIGMLNFIWYTIKKFRIYSVDIYFVSSTIALYVYGLAGFSMRRLIYWSIIMLMLAISENKEKEIDRNST